MYFNLYSGITHHFLSRRRARNDPKVVKLPGEAPVDAPPPPFVERLDHALDPHRRGRGGHSGSRGSCHTHQQGVHSDEDIDDDDVDFDCAEPNHFSMLSRSHPSMLGSSHQFYNSSHEVGAASS